MSVAGSEKTTKVLLRPCPICKFPNGTVQHSFRFAVPEGFPLPDNYDLVSCDGCGFVFADTGASQDAYDRFYSEQSKYEDKDVGSGGTSSPWDRERFISVAQHLARSVPKDSAILDVGCANGGLLSELRNVGYTNLTGIDPSERCVINVQEIGIEAIHGGIFSAVAPVFSSRRFDCVVLSHVLEHVSDLRRALNWVLGLLSQNGAVYVEVPDASRYADYYKVPYYYFDCEHINHFDPLTLDNLLIYASFSLVTMEQKEIPASANDRYPALAALFRRQPESINKKPVFSFAAKDSIEMYLHLSSEAEVRRIIDQLAESGEEVFVWGAGQYAFRLLSATRLSECRIKAFIDKDTNKQGRSLGSLPVLSPEALDGHPGPVVICSALHSADISAEIRSRGFDNKIIVLK